MLNLDFDRQSVIDMDDITAAARLRISSTLERVESAIRGVIVDAEFFDENEKAQGMA